MDMLEALRIGCEKTPQCFGLAWVDPEGKLSTCALGAIAVALDLPVKETLGIVGSRSREVAIYDELAANYPELNVRVYLPVGKLGERAGDFATSHRLLDAIYILNDRFSWPREEIGKWIEEEVYTGKAVAREGETNE